ncbi:hypothetical protein BJ508DRAFT_332319 [Ascobolus immersus RN42]|uniref:Uncharacterized protein n=1 Tax=Ascobolus immersus RN42 TaxID=1160509 RepID=A0A3N4HTS6_ASCIM|nr:hypothetical protein BJ508DRAFT_332319 [Ascobolus immersus RN42]
MGSILWKRAGQPYQAEPESNPNVKRNLLIGSLIFALLAVIVILLTILHSMRTSRAPPPPWLPQFLVPLWGSKNRSSQRYRPAPLSPTSLPNSDPNTAGAPPPTTAGVNRNTSVRSIMTLPEYRPVPRDGYERTIGREGERAGMDVVVEFPESIEEEEARREEHMEALYQLRRARAAQIEALAGSRPSAASTAAASRQVERGRSGRTGAAQVPPSAYLETAATAAAHSSASLSTLASILAAENDRRVSQVAYAEIGTARHDGSRVRASSDHDRDPLLSSAASMGGLSANHSRNNSATDSHLRSPSGLSLALSTSSALTVTDGRRSHSSSRTERRRSEDFFNGATASTALLTTSENSPSIQIDIPTPTISPANSTASRHTPRVPSITTTGPEITNTGMNQPRGSVDLAELSPPPDYSAGGLPDYASPLVANRPWEMPTGEIGAGGASVTAQRTAPVVPEVRVTPVRTEERLSRRERRERDDWMG